MGMSELPEGWAAATLNELLGAGGLFSDGDWVESKDQDPDGSNRLLQLADIGDGFFVNKSSRFVNDEKFSSLNCTEIKEGDVLIARMPDPLGRACLMPAMPQRCLTVVDVAVFRVGETGISNKWLMHFLNSSPVRREIELNSSGTTRKRISRGKLGEIVLPIPPIAEQARIAAKLDELLAQVDTLKARIDGIPALLKRFRQSVLAAAVSGQLTEEWRGAVNAADWSLTSLGAIAKRLHQGINTSADKVEYSDSGVPILQAKHITSGKIVIADARLVNAELFEKYKEKYCPPSGSILFTNIGTIGRSVVAGNSANYLIAWNIFLIEPSHNVVPEHLRMFLELLRLQGYYESLYRGGATQFVNKKQLSAIEISLPPVEEQTEIVRRVEQLFAFADQLEARVNAAQTRIDRLTQSILAKAFRGELVPQDPNDEPASALLERIKAQRAAVPKAKRGRRAATLG